MATIDTNLLAYMKQVDATCDKVFGVKYSAIQADIDPKYHDVKVLYEVGTPVDDCVAAIGIKHGFKPLSADGEAADFNLRSAALTSFVRENSDAWEMTNDGEKVTADGRFALAPAKSASGKQWGFGIYRIDGESREFVASALDIKEALERLEPEYEDTQSYRM